MHFRQYEAQKDKLQRQIEHIDELLLEQYLIWADDVRMCPKKNCKYAGVLSDYDCQESLQCRICKHKWQDPLQQRQGGGFRSLITNLRKVFETRPCPNCGVPINKDEGCSRVVCSKC